MTAAANESHESPESSAKTTASTANHDDTRAPMPLIFERHSPGAVGVDLPALDVPESPLPPASMLSDHPLPLPEVGQLDIVRHYTHLAQRSFSVDANFYPLGSCTMKYNPRINEAAAAMPAFTGLHPLQRDDDVQGALRVLYDVSTWLAEIAGLDAVSLQPAAGAHGEYAALKVIRAWFNDPQGGNAPQRNKVIAPDTAHGTNPASCAMCGAGVVTLKSKQGKVDLDALRELVDDQTAALMITNPNTAGLFDGQIGDVADILHDAGALLYLDGANMNAIVGVSRPGDFGVDVMHYNTHKTFSTPHGCGGPGAGPIAVRDFLEPYLPTPTVRRDPIDNPAAGAHPWRYHLEHDRPKTIGQVRSFWGQFGVLLRCWTYLRACGPVGLRNVGETAVLNANYLAARLHEHYETPYFNPAEGRYCAHEFVTVPRRLLDQGVTLIDLVKRMIDYDIHPPTMHWPVHDCLMIEPTETESKATLDRFVDVLLKIADEVANDGDTVRSAPHHATLRRLDEVAAARSPVLTYDGSSSRS